MKNLSAPTSEDYTNSGAWGILTSLDLFDCNPEKIRDSALIEIFTKNLCNKIDVKRYGDTQIVMFGEDPGVHGYSMVQLIETSLVSAHFAEETNATYLDIFSCKYYDPNKVIEYAMEFFEAKDFHANVILRGIKS